MKTSKISLTKHARAGLTVMTMLGLLASPLPVCHSSSFSILNSMKDGNALSVHCRSSDDDLGGRTLYPRQQEYNHFHENFWRTTLFHCSFKYRSFCQDFEVWNYIPWQDGKLFHRTKVCRWRVTEGGIDFWDGQDNEWLFFYPWKNC